MIDTYYEVVMTERAKELFLKYNGNRFHMDREGKGGEYESFHISKETEEMWTEELIVAFLKSEINGREAFRTYTAVTELLKTDRQNKNWDTILYYPLHAEYLDDVTVLYMLPDSYRMAEKAVNKNCFPGRKQTHTFTNWKDIPGWCGSVLKAVQ